MMLFPQALANLTKLSSQKYEVIEPTDSEEAKLSKKKHNEHINLEYL